MIVINQRLKKAQDYQKRYVDSKHMDRSNEKVSMVFIHVKPMKSLFKYGKGDNLLPIIVGSFEILEKI